MTFSSLSDDDMPRIRGEARDWLLELMGAGKNHNQVLDDCREWRARDSRHDRAFRRAERAWSALGVTETVRCEDWRRGSAVLDSSRDAVRPLTIGLRMLWPLALAASIVALIAIPVLRDKGHSLATNTGQIRSLALSDGSRVHIGAKSEIEVRYASDQREVVLDKGQAFFEVVHDESRPFTVIAGDSEIRVTGTKFDVNRIGDDIRVSVQQGRVEVRRRNLLPFLDERSPEQVLTAGQVSHLSTTNRFTPPEPTDTEATQSWLNGRLYYTNRPLSDAINDANRYSDAPIHIANEAVGAMRITTSFRTAAINDLLTGLEKSFPLRIVRQSDQITIEPSEPHR